MLKSLRTKIINNPELIFRIVLFLAFLGHGLVSLGYSTSIKLHYALINSVNFTNFSESSILNIVAYFDLIVSFLILFKIGRKITLYFVIAYLSTVAIAALSFYFVKTGEIFGVAEIMRRFPWIFYSIFLIYSYQKEKQLKFNLLRLGLAFAFLSHGLASLGIWGLNAGHIELANNVVKAQDVRFFILGSGLVDTSIGIFLMLGIYSQIITKVATFWILFVVVLSFMTGFPDGIFRTGFLISAMYIALDRRCHTRTIFNFRSNNL